jgi:hypothetical protein
MGYVAIIRELGRREKKKALLGECLIFWWVVEDSNL